MVSNTEIRREIYPHSPAIAPESAFAARNPRSLVQDIYLYPNEFYWLTGNYRIHTLLGSCIAICVWHPQTRAAGISHSLLPTRPHAEQSVTGLDPRFVNEAVQILKAKVRETQSHPAEYRVAIFGGANMLQLTNQRLPLGKANIRMAHEALAAQGFSIAFEQTGGNTASNLTFETWTGTPRLKRQN